MESTVLRYSHFLPYLLLSLDAHTADSNSEHALTTVSYPESHHPVLLLIPTCMILRLARLSACTPVTGAL